VQIAELDSTLRKHWHLEPRDIEPLTGGLDSRTWALRSGDGQWVAKLVPPSGLRSLRAGLDTATLVQAAGIPAGAPLAARNGRSAVLVGRDWLAVLEWVDGAPLGTSPHDQTIIGSTLGAVHASLAGAPTTSAPRFDWLDPDAPHLGMTEWLRPTVRAAVTWFNAAAAQLVSRGLLHGDPAPWAFRWSQQSNTCGLIDWSSTLWGPLLYDLASAVMFVGGMTRAQPLIAAYRLRGPIRPGEIDAGLASMLRFRWAVQADYFARRLVTDEHAGLATPEDNERGLVDARVHLIGS
jgi:Ser/Thr protein kinase RdoA (MazF antagonist)